MAIDGLSKDVNNDEVIYAVCILSHEIGNRCVNTIVRVKDVDTSDAILNSVVTVGKVTGATKIEIIIRNRSRIIDPKVYTIRTICEESIIHTYNLLKNNGVI